MRFVLGQPPDDPSFHPDARAGWRKVREMGPRALMAVGTVMGIPLTVLIGFLWSRIPLSPLSFRIDSIGLGSGSVVLLPLVMMIALATPLIALVVAHEFVHVLAFPRFGLTSATVFGVWPSRFLPYAHHSGPVTHRRLMVVALAPFIVLSVVPLLASYIGLLRSPLWALFSILNAMACGGDAAVLLTFAYQLPLNATLRNKGWNTWWHAAEQSHALEPAAGSVSNGESLPPAQ